MRRAPFGRLLARIRLPIQTPRLLLRPPRRSDVPVLARLVGDRRISRPTTIPHPYSTRDGYDFVRSEGQKRRRGESLALLILDKASGGLLGGTGLHQINWKDRRFELGYWVDPTHWGKGIAAEAAYAVCREGFGALQLHRVHATVYAFNPGSARVLRKIGFRLEGRSREHHRDGHGWVDVLQYGLLRDELRPPPKTTQRF
jgi:RimJ/RimL family protein N-acetyltransferase